MAEADPAFSAETTEARRPKKGRALRTLLMLIVPLLLLAGGAYMWIQASRYATTDNAYVHQDSVAVTAEVGGPIVEIAVAENETVEKGDLLFRINPEPYRIALMQAEADLASAQVGVGQLETQAAGTGVDIAGAREDISYAEDAFQRQQELLDRGFTTRASWEDARHELQDARERLRQDEAARANAQAALARGSAPDYPAIEAAKARIEEAKLNLARTEVYAPISGVVSQTDRLQEGQQVVSGVPVVTIVASTGGWIEANFKETDLGDIVPGMPATVEIDAYPGVELSGHGASIGAGTGSNFSLLPAQNATGNWVKVTQRVPVRIELDEESPRPLIAGLSADVSIDLKADGDR